jgi:SPP1 gp7 family putative phage head morphogenesis protein
MARKIKHRKFKLSFKLSESRQKYVKNRTTTLNGEPVRMNPRTADRYALKVEKEVRKMHLDVSGKVEKLFDSSTAKKSVAMDASISSQARILMNKLIDKWTKRFNWFGINWTDDLMGDVTDQSGKDLSKSLEKLSGGLTINTSTIGQRTNDIIVASTDQCASLIKTIAPEYLKEVKQAVMRSITDDTKSFTELKNSIHEMLQSRYKKYKNKAKNTSLDQTRKAYNSITRSRMRDAGITHFKWNHSGGSVKPRCYHRDELNGKVFDLNNPPIIDKKTGETGFPGQLINCKCFQTPVIKFDDGQPD